MSNIFTAAVTAIATTFSWQPEIVTDPPARDQFHRTEVVRMNENKSTFVNHKIEREPRPMDDCPVPGRTDYDQHYVAAAIEYKLPDAEGISAGCWLKAQAHAESNQDPEATSSANAQGVMQLLPGTFSDMGYQDIRNPRQNT